MPSTTYFHNVTAAQALPRVTGGDPVIIRADDDSGSSILLIVTAATQADMLIKAGLQTLDMLNENQPGGAS